MLTCDRCKKWKCNKGKCSECHRTLCALCNGLKKVKGLCYCCCQLLFDEARRDRLYSVMCHYQSIADTAKYQLFL